MRWMVSQIGAREHYSIPRGFAALGHLRLLYTDMWCKRGASLLQKAPMPFRAIAGRKHDEISPAQVKSFTFRTLFDNLRHRGGPASTEAAFDNYLRIGNHFSARVNRHLAKQKLDPQSDCFFAFNTGALQTLQLLKERGIRTVVDQIDPARTEDDLVRQESEKFPGWQKLPGRIPDRYFDHLRAEWDAATVVLVNSNWSKRALMQQGVAEEKILVVPVAYEVHGTPSPRVKTTGPLKVLWLGTVNLRKGIQYLIGAAKLLSDRNIEFHIAGPIDISDEAMKTAPASMKFMGRVNRADSDQLYRQADLFVLPTVSDGFAITQVEAMARGLPVITTPNCGDVVTHNQDGLIVPAFSADAFAEAIARLDEDRDALLAFSARAIEKSRNFSPVHHAQLIENRMIEAGMPASR